MADNMKADTNGHQRPLYRVEILSSSNSQFPSHFMRKNVSSCH